MLRDYGEERKRDRRVTVKNMREGQEKRKSVQRCTKVSSGSLTIVDLLQYYAQQLL